MINMCFNPINGSGSADLSELLHVYTSSRTCVFRFQTELDSGGDCSGANSGNCKTGFVCDATGNTCSEFVCLFVFYNAPLF